MSASHRPNRTSLQVAQLLLRCLEHLSLAKHTQPPSQLYNQPNTTRYLSSHHKHPQILPDANQQDVRDVPRIGDQLCQPEYEHQHEPVLQLRWGEHSYVHGYFSAFLDGEIYDSPKPSIRQM